MLILGVVVGCQKNLKNDIEDLRNDLLLPNGIIVLQKQLELDKDSVGFIDFRVNPSGANFNYDVSSEECELDLDLVGKIKIQSKTYITNTINCALTDIQLVKDLEGNIKPGQYRCFIKDSGGSEEYKEQIVLVLSVENEKGESVRLSSEVVTISRRDQSSSNMLEFKFESKLNPDYIQSDLTCEIVDDKISVHIPYYTESSHLVATFKSSGVKVLAGEQEQESGVTVNDFSVPVVYKVVAKDGNIKEYTVSVTRFTGLPVVFISTERAGIHDKDNWVTSTMKIDGGLMYDNYESDEVYVRGRGNSTWGMPKKPYAIKLGKKAELLSMPKHKRWVLLANYSDKTMLRTATAFMMSEKISDLAYTPRHRFVELFLDNVYMGTYQLCEHIKIDENRVNVTENGYILEVDHLEKLGPDDIYFETPRLLFSIKDPDVDRDSKAYNDIKNYITEIENVLYGEYFTDPEKGYSNYIDVVSFVDWYLINEITKNNDAAFYSSCFMNYRPGGKLHMGPIWDFDISLGNHINDNAVPEGFYIKGTLWISRLFEDPAFRNVVKERYKLFCSRKNEIMQCINVHSTYLKWSVIENNAKWNVFYNYTWPNYAIWGSYNNEVQYLKNWLNTRMNWLNKAFEELN